MSYAQTRTVMQKIADSKMEDAILLFNNGRFSNAYYLAGYAVEIALKACIAKHVQADTIPDKQFILDAHSHSFAKLVGTAGLTAELKAEQNRDSEFHANWGIANEWNTASRYDATDKSTVHYLVNAIADPNHGVLRWIKKHW
jgi:HEPN domain